MLVHEVGHIAACRKFGIDHGEIGFGFYLIFPVVYADVTKIWTLDKHKRTIANLGGIYLELVYASILTAIYLYTAEMVFLVASVFVFIKALTELNPFIRYDGYWVLSDLTNTQIYYLKQTVLLATYFLRKITTQKVHSNGKRSISCCSHTVFLTGYSLQHILVGFSLKNGMM
jgi:putative peptide zinc metalloprotease protein